MEAWRWGVSTLTPADPGCVLDVVADLPVKLAGVLRLQINEVVDTTDGEFDRLA